MGALAAKVRSGEITRQSLVWKPGMGAWLAAEGVAELQPLFANVPPRPCRRPDPSPYWE